MAKLKSYFVVQAVIFWDKGIEINLPFKHSVDKALGVGFMPVYGSYAKAYKAYPEHMIKKLKESSNASKGK